MAFTPGEMHRALPSQAGTALENKPFSMMSRLRRQLAIPQLRRRQRGVAAVEFAVILPILIAVMVYPLFIGRTFMHYTVSQKAAQDAAIFLAGMPLFDVSNEARFDATAVLAQGIVDAEIAELSPSSSTTVHVNITCDGYACGSARPDKIRVTIQMRMYDDIFSALTGPIFGTDGILLRADVSMKYVGR